MLKALLKISVLVCWAGYSYSNNLSPYYGSTGNAINYGIPWSMDSVLPDPSGTSVNNVFYTYTPIKNTSDNFEVEIGNWNADRSGYVWKETDNWDGAPGGIAIIKNVPLPYVHRSQFGDGFLETTGQGSVTDASLVYTYKVDPCYNPQYDPACPGFVPPKIEEVDLDSIYETVESDSGDVRIDTEEVYDEEREKTEQELEEEEAKEKEKSKMRLEKAMSEVDNSALFAESFAQGLMLQQINNAVNVNTYLNKNIQGGVYEETIKLKGGYLPDNKSGKRMNWSTQKLHEELVDMQYRK